MDLRLVTASLLLLGTAAMAQLPTPPAPVIPTTTPAQDPDKPKQTPADAVKELTSERDRLAREIAYAQERAKNGKAFLASKFSAKPQAFKSIDAGVTAPPMPVMQMPAQPRTARLATKDEIASHTDDTMLIVNGRALPQGVFDQVMAYLAATPASGDESARAQRALFDLVRIEAVASSFEENEAAERVGGIQAELEAGKSIAELAKSVGTVPGANADGRIEVTRNSAFGPRFEQIAFSTEAGKRTRPFRNAMGIVILQVESMEKGASPELDKVIATALQVPYTPEAEALQKSHLAVNTGQVDIFARDQKALDLLPEMFRRPAPMMQPAPTQGVNVEVIQKQMKQLMEDMKALQGSVDPDAVKKLQIMQQQYDMAKQQLRAAEAAGTSFDAVNEVKVEGVPPVKKN